MIRHPFILSIFAFIAVSFSPSVFASPVPESFEKCLVLKQKDLAVGNMTLYLGQKHVRIDGMNGRCTFIAQAPRWDVTVYNKDKQYFVVGRDDWNKDGMKNIELSHKGFFDFKRNPPRPLIYMGKKAYSASYSADPPNGGTMELMYQPANRVKQDGVSRGTRTLIASSDFSLNADVGGFVEGFYLTNPDARIMLLSELDCNQHKSREFETKSIGYENVPLSKFVIPKGLKKAFTLMAVATGSDIESIMLDASEAKH